MERRRQRRCRGPAAALLLLVTMLGAKAAAGAGGRSLPQFSDDVPFRVNWPGIEFTLPTAGVLYKEDHYIIMTTSEKEKYKCILPMLASGNEEEEKDYKGPSPAELLEPLFKQSSCSYRIESYWTYEVCHGKHIRQYHEEKETGQKINIQEYFLGNVLHKSPILDPEQEEKENEKDSAKEIPMKNIEGQMTPYYPIGMGNGTPCTLRQNLPRSSSVMYVCHPEAKHEILSVAEVTTCEYEVVILTPLLCSHPKYRFRASPVNDIFCQSLPGAPLKPHNLQKLEQLEQEHQQQQEMMKPPYRRGKEGVGWWRYEFCYGKYVHQYHKDKDNAKTTIVVGTWNKEEHLQWAQKNVARAYHLKDDGLQTVKMVSHYYGNGDLCDLTDKPRQVTVKLKCKESDSPHAVTVYMLEPHSCQYVLGVESPVICKILDTADENGMLSVPS
ncbi:Uncharacterized protein PODLI_1B020916 [Podarcis lilfordi]|uniref:Endoplasmic reticulum lectin n=1 Tax=Podarcis lilfordi TaxID=74358 RepID=A0AA35K6Q1_9SAUR|nr:Uncharacterized protein PODLI_1B020916 [Podarcis lilfordi]